MSSSSDLFSHAGYGNTAAPPAVPMNPNLLPGRQPFQMVPSNQLPLQTTGAGASYATAPNCRGSGNAPGSTGYLLRAGSEPGMVNSGTPWTSDIAATSSNHVIWGGIESQYESQESCQTNPYGSAGKPAEHHSGSRKKIQNKRITEGITFLDSKDSMSSGGFSEEGVSAHNHSPLQQRAPYQHNFVYSAQAFQSGDSECASPHTAASSSPNSPQQRAPYQRNFVYSAQASESGDSEGASPQTAASSSHSLPPQRPAHQSHVVYSAQAFQAAHVAPRIGVEEGHLNAAICDPEADSSGDDSDEDQKQQAQLGRQKAWKEAGVNLEELLAQVPVGEDGQPTSIGSIGHAAGECKAPCSFVQRTRGCSNAANCSFCHFPHKVKRERPKQKGKPRPCKGKRDKYRKHWEQLKTEVEENPSAFDPESVALPASISTYEKLRAKLVTRLKTHKDQVLAEVVIEDRGAPSRQIGDPDDPSQQQGNHRGHSATASPIGDVHGSTKVML